MPENHIVWYWLGLAAFPVFLTGWGWRHVVIPVLWPAIRFCFISFKYFFWIGFFQMILWTPLAYRTWGFTLFHLFYACHDGLDAQQFFYEYERDHTYSGAFEENWRRWHDQPPIDIHWQWSTGSVYHVLPTWTILIVPGVLACLFYRWLRNRQRPITTIIPAPKQY